MHKKESDLALFATGDLSAWQRFKVSIHVRQCDRCRGLADAFRGDAEFVKSGAQDLPSGVDWDRLSAEMTANIHLGLAAGECVAPPKRRESVNSWDNFRGWPAAAAAAGIMVLIGSAWWLNMPPGTAGRITDAIVKSGPFGQPDAERGPVLEASPAGIEFRENGGALGVAALNGAPLTVTVSNTEASAQYMNEDTGQLVIATVYVE